MCVPDYYTLNSTNLDDVMRAQARLNAKQRAANQAKCDALKVLDVFISEAKPGDTIYDVLFRAKDQISALSFGAHDTLVKLLKLEGYK